MTPPNARTGAFRIDTSSAISILIAFDESSSDGPAVPTGQSLISVRVHGQAANDFMGASIVTSIAAPDVNVDDGALRKPYTSGSGRLMFSPRRAHVDTYSLGPRFPQSSVRTIEPMPNSLEAPLKIYRDLHMEMVIRV